MEEGEQQSVITAWLFELLQEKQSEESWTELCAALLKTDNELEPTALAEETETTTVNTNKHRINALRDEITIVDPSIMGPMDRPFYLGMARTIAYCFQNKELPPSLVRNPIHLLAVTNRERLDMIQKELTTMEHSKLGLRQFLFHTLLPEDWRILLHIRTTTGGNTLSVMPPSLTECIDTFTRVYQKPNAKPRRHGQQYQLSVGAKALSKHWHRDREEQFWGICTGTETKKNEHANQVLIKILSDPVWINLHSLPHDRTVYEIRQSQGYGVRWTVDEKGGLWNFRGFLEPQMEDGHASKWVH